MDKKRTKQELLEQLYAPYKKCLECPLGSLGRTNVVFGQGNPDAQLLFIGEAPGRDEDLKGEPFVGRSARLLTKALDAYGIVRTEIYITNIVKCRPPANRKPLPLEAKTCKNLFLFNQINIIKPRVICTLGSFALQELLDKTVQITKIRGIPIDHEGITIIPTYHPAYILRNPAELTSFVLDIEKVAELLQKKL